jgi:hypothetical protein
MNDLAFIASVVSSLAIPATVVTALLIFRGPLASLLGRIISYEGLGQKVNFGQKLAGAEESVSRAVAQAHETAEKAQLDGIAPENPVTERALREITSTEQALQDVDLQTAGLVQLAELATANPSFVVIKAWEDLFTRLTAMVKTMLPDADVRNPIYWLPELARDRQISESFPAAVLELFELRNNVAHGQHNPTPGEAVTYVESVRQLAGVAAGVTGYFMGRRAAERELQKHSDRQHSPQGKEADSKR